MAHKEQRDFLTDLKNAHPEWFNGVTVLEVGSLNINGTVRDFFHPTEYLGVDVAPGPGVDLVALGQDLDHPDNSFDIAISAECFEHNPEWEATFLNMHRIAKTAVIITCASTGREEHGTHDNHPTSSPLTLDWNYYRNLTADDFEDNFDLCEMFSEWALKYNAISCDLYFWGIKHASDTNTQGRQT
jgi:SAM-dependent methyltransferase